MKGIKFLFSAVFFSFSFFSFFPLFSQKVVYEYDLAGNRAGRTIILPPQNSNKKPMEEEKIETFTDLLNEREIQIYPNPTEGILFVKTSFLEEGEQGLIQIYTLNGNIIKSLPIKGVETRIDLSQSSSGTYIMIITLNEETTNWKIIKK